MNRSLFNRAGVALLLLSLVFLCLVWRYANDDMQVYGWAVVVLGVVMLLILANVRSPAGAIQLIVSAALLFVPAFRTYQLGFYDVQVIQWWVTLAGCVGVLLLLGSLNAMQIWLLEEKLGRLYMPNHPQFWH